MPRNADAASFIEANSRRNGSSQQFCCQKTFAGGLSWSWKSDSEMWASPVSGLSNSAAR
jgi:hypothetical protein